MTTRVLFLVPALLGVLGAPCAALAQQSLRPEDAAKYVGHTTMVCGRVAQAFYDTNNPRGLTVLNLVRPYPDHVFSVIIWGKDRPKFERPPETAYKEKDICVSGLISSFKGRPQVVVDGPDQIRLQSE